MTIAVLLLLAQAPPTPPLTTISGGAAGAVIRPEMNSATAIALGKSKVGLWTCELCSQDFTNTLHIRRERIIGTGDAVHLPILRNAEAIDILTRVAANHPYSVIGNNGDAILGLSGGVASAVGVGSKMPAAGWIGVGMTGAQLIFRLLARRAPNPTPYFAQLLPDEVAIAPGDCGTWLIVTSLVKNPKTIVVNGIVGRMAQSAPVGGSK